MANCCNDFGSFIKDLTEQVEHLTLEEESNGKYIYIYCVFKKKFLQTKACL